MIHRFTSQQLQEVKAFLKNPNQEKERRKETGKQTKVQKTVRTRNSTERIESEPDYRDSLEGESYRNESNVESLYSQYPPLGQAATGAQ